MSASTNQKHTTLTSIVPYSELKSMQRTSLVTTTLWLSVTLPDRSFENTVSTLDAVNNKQAM